MSVVGSAERRTVDGVHTHGELLDLSPNMIVCGLSVRKSRIHLQNVELKLIPSSLFISVCGMIVLNTELKSMTSVPSEALLLSKIRWRAVVIIIHGLPCELEKTQCGRKAGSMWPMTSLSKHLVMVDVSATGWKSFRQVTRATLVLV